MVVEEQPPAPGNAPYPIHWGWGSCPTLGPGAVGGSGQVGTRWALHGAGVLRAPAVRASELLLHGVGQTGWGARDRGEVGEPRGMRQDFR